MSNDSNPSDAPDGAPDETPAMVPRAELLAERERAERMTAQRRDVGGKLDIALAKIQELEAGGSPPAPDTTDTGADASPETADSSKFAALAQGLESLSKKLDSYNTRRGDDARTAFANKVPEENREDALLMLDGMVKRGLDLTDPSAVDTALGKLNPMLLRDPSRPAPLRAPQKLADDKLDWTAFKTWDEIPQDYRARVPDDVARRLSGRSSNASGGRGLFGSR